MRIEVAKPNILLCGHADPPTPEQIDDLLAAVAASAYASEAVQVIEEWLEARYGYPGAFTAQERESKP